MNLDQFPEAGVSRTLMLDFSFVVWTYHHSRRRRIVRPLRHIRESRCRTSTLVCRCCLGQIRRVFGFPVIGLFSWYFMLRQ